MPIFEGFPYLVTRLVPGFYHIALVPGSWPRDRLEAFARQQVAANRLQTCLALETGVGIYFEPDGRVSRPLQPPVTGLSISGRLHLAVAVPPSAELAARAEQLARFEAAQPRTGYYLLGDVTKGGRCATPEEVLALAGTQAEGVPQGLARCPVCREWRGSCLDPSPQFQGSIMTVWCQCDNDNRCARCVNGSDPASSTRTTTMNRTGRFGTSLGSELSRTSAKRSRRLEWSQRGPRTTTRKHHGF